MHKIQARESEGKSDVRRFIIYKQGRRSEEGNGIFSKDAIFKKKGALKEIWL